MGKALMNVRDELVNVIDSALVESTSLLFPIIAMLSRLMTLFIMAMTASLPILKS
jgi:hypothetical protein